METITKRNAQGPRERTKTKISIDLKKIRKPLDAVFKTINKSTVLPILEDVFVQRDGGFITYSTTDLENIMTISVPDDGDTTRFLFPGIEMKYLVRNAIGNRLDISVEDDSDQPDICVRSDGFKLNLPTLKVGDYPKFVKVENQATFPVDTKEILPLLEISLLFASTDNLRPAMTGVLLKDVNGFLQVAATDAHRLFWKNICKTPAAYKGRSILISQKGVRLIIEAFKTERDITICADENNAAFKCETKELITRLYDHRYPDYQAVIPTDLRLTYFIKRKELIASLNLCRNFTNKSTKSISIAVSPSKIDLNGGDPDFGMDFMHAVSVVSPSIDTFSPYTMGMNADFLLEAARCSGEELIKISHSMNPIKPIIVDDSILIMPLMLNA